MRRIALTAFLTLLLAALPPAADADEKPRRPAAGAVDLVLALDTSGSMEGLIASARDKFWAVVTELSRARPEPDLRVGLITYGGVGRDDLGNVLLRSDLTYDFDALVEAIDATAVAGGREYVGGALEVAIRRMGWRRGALKVVFLAGNESVDQDRRRPVRALAAEAAAAGIKVNTVYCGGADDGIAGGWREVAALGAGTFATIDHDHGTRHVASPYDKDLLRLSQRLSGTYRFYGAEGKARAEAQAASDARARDAGAPVAAERAAAKATPQYARVGDLVRAAEADDFDWSRIPEAELPPDLRGLTPAERRRKLDALRADRARLEIEIRALSEKREAHVRAQRRRLQLDDGRALDRALRDAIRAQARAAGFVFPASK